jgi:D-alanyl-lipoteichoic acid acyltransferase DltB (MBOAT superfamily)
MSDSAVSDFTILKRLKLKFQFQGKWNGSQTLFLIVCQLQNILMSVEKGIKKKEY